MGQMANLLPSGQLQYMKQLVDGSMDSVLPPTTDEVKEWKTFYSLYFNSDKSVKEGRRLPKHLCVKNPRPDEISEALGRLGFRSICDNVSSVCTNSLTQLQDRKHPSDAFHPGRIKFRLFDQDGKPTNPKFKSSKIPI